MLDLALKEVENEEDEVENGNDNETTNCTEEIHEMRMRNKCKLIDFVCQYTNFVKLYKVIFSKESTMCFNLNSLYTDKERLTML